MKKTTYVNKTTYTLDHFIKVSRFNNISGSRFYMILLLISVPIYVAVNNFFSEGSHLVGFICLGITLLDVPFFAYYLPKISGKRRYDRLMKETGNREMIVTTEISDKVISRNNAGQNTYHPFSQVTALNLFQNMLVITFKDRQVLYLDMDSFQNNDGEAAVSYLSEAAGVKVKDEKR